MTIAIKLPCNANCFIACGVKIPSFGLRGFSFNTSLEDCSIPIAIAGRESVTKLINNRCTGKNGTGSANKEQTRTQRIPDKLPLNK